MIFVSVPGAIVVGHRETQLLLSLKGTVQPETTGNREIREIECKNGIVEYGETPPSSLTVRSNPGLDFERRGKFLEFSQQETSNRDTMAWITSIAVRVVLVDADRGIAAAAPRRTAMVADLMSSGIVLDRMSELIWKEIS